MATYNERSATAQARMADLQDKLSQAQKTGGLLQIIGEAGEGAYELGRGLLGEGRNILGNILFGEKYTPITVPTAENSEIARRIMGEMGIESLPIRDVDYKLPSSVSLRLDPYPTESPPPFDPRSVEQRVADDRAERAELARRSRVVTPAAEIDRTGGMTGAEAYMQEAARLREAEKQQEAAALKQKMDRDNATGTPNIMPYVLAGDNQAQNARERSFLERMSQSGLLSTLQGMARAERQYGVGPLAAFSESALDVQAARSAAEQKAKQRWQLELAKERIKAGDGGDAIRKMLAKGETQKLLATAGNTFKMLNASEKIRNLLGQEGASGVVNAAKTWATQFGNIFGLNLDPTTKQTVEQLSAMIKQQMAGSRIFGRDLSKTDYDVLAKVLIDPTLVTSDEGIRNQYKRLINDLEQTHAQSVKSLNILIGRDTTRQLLGQQKVTENLFTEVKQ